MRRVRLGWITVGLVFLLLVATEDSVLHGLQSPATSVPGASTERVLLDQYCVRCHNEQLNTGGIAFDAADVDNVGTDVMLWERTARKLRARAMPPRDLPRPDDADYDSLVLYLETSLDRPSPWTDIFRGYERHRLAGDSSHRSAAELVKCLSQRWAVDRVRWPVWEL